MLAARAEDRLAADGTRTIDWQDEAKKINLLRELPITILISLHDMRMVQELFPRTLVMDEGLIVADWDTREILEDGKFLNEHGLEKPYCST